MDPHQVVLTAHLFGLAFGMGGAGTIDAIFLVACRRGRVTRELVEVVHVATGLVAGATVLLAVSGGAFFAVGAEATPKFWAKMVIVAIACLNGLAAHRRVFPLIAAASAAGNGRLHLRPWQARLAAASAAVSGVSWSGALILGAWRGPALGAVPTLAAYASVLAAAVLVSAILIAPRVFVIAPARVRRPRGRARGTLRTLPAAAARAVALAILDAALVITARVGSGDRWAKTDTVDRFTAPADVSMSGWLPAADVSDQARGIGEPLRPGLPHELFGSDGRYPRLYRRNPPNHDIGTAAEPRSP